jgi:hypothetical protein
VKGIVMSNKTNERNRFRELCKVLYRLKKEESREVGLKVNSLIQELHFEVRQSKEMNLSKEEMAESGKYIERTLNDIVALRKEDRIGQEFPSFSKFFKFLRKNNMTFHNVRDMIVESAEYLKRQKV